jgi:Cdc6-like AAA superfamily ATPase
LGKEVTNQFLEGYNGTIFAYGSTGSGKTFTMFGNDDGLVPCVVEEIFSKLDSNSKLSCSMIEIYK